MAKRYTDTSKYKKEFIRGLRGAYKLLWDYLYHECDHAGIWIVDFEIAQIYLGSDMPVNRAEALKNFNEGEIRVIELSKTKWFLPGFVEFQYYDSNGKLNPDNRVHASVIKILKSYDLIDEEFKIKNKPLTSPLEGAKDKDKDKDKLQGQGQGPFEKGGVGEKTLEDKPEKSRKSSPKEELENPFSQEFYKNQFGKFKQFRIDKKKSIKGVTEENALLKTLWEYSGGDEVTAEKILRYSINGGYPNIYELKENKNQPAGTSENTNYQSNQELHSETIDLLVEGWNQVTGQSYPRDSVDFRGRSEMMLRKGYNPKSMIEVAQLKMKQWKNDAKMKSLIRLSTIWGENYSEYEQEVAAIKSGAIEAPYSLKDQIEDAKSQLKAMGMY